MKLHRLQLTNFRQLAEAEIEFHSGLTGVIGTNGAGKSTILEAVTYALYGADAIRGTKSSIRWNRAPARKVAEVVLEFEVNGVRYVIRRSEATASLDTMDGQIATGTSHVNEFVPRLLGLTLKEFSASHLCAQKDLMRLATMGGTERQQFFRNVMGVGRVDEAVKAARAAKNDLAREREGLAAGLGERGPLEAELEQAEVTLLHAHYTLKDATSAATIAAGVAQQADEALTASSERKTRHEQLTRERDEAEKAVEESSAEIDRLTNEIREAEAAAARVTEQEPKLAELPRLRAKRDELVEARAAVRERETLLQRINELQEEVAGHLETAAFADEEAGKYDKDAHEALRIRTREATERMEALRESRLDERGDWASKNRAADIRADEAAKAIERLREMGPDSPCPTCTRALAEQYEPVIATLETARAAYAQQERDAYEHMQRLSEPGAGEQAATAEADALSSELEAMDELARTAESDLRTAALEREQVGVKAGRLSEAREKRAALPSIEYDAEELIAVEAQIRTLDALGASLADDRALAGRREALVRDRSAWLKKNGDAVTRSAQATFALHELGFDDAAHSRLQTAAADAREKKQAAQVALARAEEAVTSADQRKARAETALAGYDERAAKLADLSERLRIADVASERLADFRVSVASGIRPEMEELVSGFVSILTDGRYEAVTLSEDFECQLYRDGVGLEVISGGEEDVAALAMRLATSQMIAERAGHSLSLMVLDEPFGSQDEVRRGNMLALLRRLEAVFPQVILISHVPEVQNTVDHAVVVEFDQAEGRSTVRCLSVAGVS